MQQDGEMPRICSTLDELAVSTWEHMEYQLARGFRPPDERGFTDHHLVEIAIRHPQARVKLFTGNAESETGADWEWWFGDPHHGYVGLLVQAKKLGRAGRYSELCRKIGATEVRQMDRLIEVCTTGTANAAGEGTDEYIGLEPVYVFFNGPRTGDPTMPQDRCKNPERDEPWFSGCTIARAREVRAIQEEDWSPPRDRVSEIAPMTWPWACLLCCTSFGGKPLAQRISDFLTGAPAPGATGRWVPAEQGHGVNAGDRGSVRIWEPRDTPDYVQMIATNDIPGDVDERMFSKRPGARTVVVVGEDVLDG